MRWYQLLGATLVSGAFALITTALHDDILNKSKLSTAECAVEEAREGGNRGVWLSLRCDGQEGEWELREEEAIAEWINAGLSQPRTCRLFESRRAQCGSSE